MGNIAGVSSRMVTRFAAQIMCIREVYSPDSSFTVLDLGTELGYTARTIKEEFPNARVSGVEIHNEMLENAKLMNGQYYEMIYHGCARKFLEDCNHYDVIVAAEIIEHMVKEVGVPFLEAIKQKCDLAIVTSPLGYHPQGALMNNPHEVHLSGWDPEEFEQVGFSSCLIDPTGYTLGVYLWKRV